MENDAAGEEDQGLGGGRCDGWGICTMRAEAVKPRGARVGSGRGLSWGGDGGEGAGEGQPCWVWRALTCRACWRIP